MSSTVEFHVLLHPHHLADDRTSKGERYATLKLDVLKSPGNDRTVATVQLASGRLIRGKASYSIVHLRLACAERNRLVCSHLIDSRVSGFRLVEHVARMTTYLE